jgi:Zn-dependent protease
MLTSEDVRIVGYLGETPVVVRGHTWLPLTQLATFLVMFWYKSQHPSQRPMGERLVFAGLASTAILGSEWAHNLAHWTISQKLHKPMDEFQILFGMPRCIYYDLNDPNVTPHQHILRSLAGPLLNASLIPLLVRLRKDSQPGSVAHEIWDSAVGMNVFLAIVSLLPIPGIDGGPILKWSLVDQGKTPEQADQVVQNINGPLAVLLGLGSIFAYLRRKRFWALLLGMLSSLALGVFLGWIQESEILQSTSSGRRASE